MFLSYALPIGPRFHHDKGKHGKDSFVRPRTKRSLGSDNTEGGTRTRRRSCTVKTSISPSPSPTPLIECPERNCNKKYKHINGLRYHQAHAHLDSVADADEKVPIYFSTLYVSFHSLAFHPSIYPSIQVSKYACLPSFLNFSSALVIFIIE